MYMSFNTLLANILGYIRYLYNVGMEISLYFVYYCSNANNMNSCTLYLPRPVFLKPPRR